jgi:perosamine synthetase
LPGVEFQLIPKDVEPVIWAVALRIDTNCFRRDRDSLMTELLRRGIETRPGFYPFTVMPLYSAPPLPVAESVSRDIISLPSYASLSNDDIDFVCDQVKSLAGE